MGKKLNKTDRAKYDRLMRGMERDPLKYSGLLDDFAHEMDLKYGETMREIEGYSEGGVATSKKYANPVTIVDNLKKKNK